MARKPDIQYVRYCTDGSAARKLEVSAPKAAPKRPRTKRKKHILVHIDPAAVLGIMMAAVMIVLMVAGCVSLNSSRREVAVMEQQVAQLRKENAALQEEYITGFDPDQVKQTALGLGMVPQEEVERVTIHVPASQEPAEPDGWDKLTSFLTGLFA